MSLLLHVTFNCDVQIRVRARLEICLAEELCVCAFVRYFHSEALRRITEQEDLLDFSKASPSPTLTASCKSALLQSRTATVTESLCNAI